MASKFYTTDSAKWRGRFDIVPGKTGDRAKRLVGKWCFDVEADKTGTLAKLETAYSAALDALDRTREAKEQIVATGKYTPLGVTEAVGKHAVEDTLPALRRARATLEKVRNELDDKRANLGLPAPKDENERRAHEEIRAALRAMPADARAKMVNENRNDPTFAAAIAGGLPVLSGVSPVTHANIKNDVMRAAHAETFDLIDALAEPLEMVDRATELGREAIRETLGLDRAVFAELARVAEANDGELPFRVQREVIGGKLVEIGEVYDGVQKTWRRATADEIARAA